VNLQSSGSIAVMPRVVGSTLFLVGTGRRSIVAATNGSNVSVTRIPRGRSS